MALPVTAWIAVGANLGDARANVLQAIQALDEGQDMRVVRCSSLYKTAPVEAFGPDFINAVVELQTCLCAPALLGRLHQIEAASARQRTYRNAPRTLDLDILLYGTGRISSAALTIPHPRMLQRAFVLVPLAEIAPGLVSALQLQTVQGQSITQCDMSGDTGNPDRVLSGG